MYQTATFSCCCPAGTGMKPLQAAALLATFCAVICAATEVKLESALPLNQEGGMGQAHTASRKLLQLSEPGCRYGGRFYKDGEQRVGFWGSCETCTLICCNREWRKDDCTPEGPLNPTPIVTCPLTRRHMNLMMVRRLTQGQAVWGRIRRPWCGAALAGTVPDSESKPCTRVYIKISDDQKSLNGATVQG